MRLWNDPIQALYAYARAHFRLRVDAKTIYALRFEDIRFEDKVIAMSKKLGKIPKPLAEEYANGRKLYCVPLLFTGKSAPKDYLKLYDQYWVQVEENVAKLELTGKADKIYHESIFLTGKEGLESIKQQSKRSHQLVKSKMSQGALLIALEDKQMLVEYLDWGLCLSMVRSPEVVGKIQKFYREAEERRDKQIVKRIDDTLKNGEVGVLLMNDESRIRIQPKLPANIHVFLVHPPVLNDIYQWIRTKIKETTMKSDWLIHRMHIMERLGAI